MCKCEIVYLPVNIIFYLSGICCSCFIPLFRDFLLLYRKWMGFWSLPDVSYWHRHTSQIKSKIPCMYPSNKYKIDKAYDKSMYMCPCEWPIEVRRGDWVYAMLVGKECFIVILTNLLIHNFKVFFLTIYMGNKYNYKPHLEMGNLDSGYFVCSLLTVLPVQGIWKRVIVIHRVETAGAEELSSFNNNQTHIKYWHFWPLLKGMNYKLAGGRLWLTSSMMKSPHIICKVDK